MKKTLSIGMIIALVGFPNISETIYTPALPDVVKSLSTHASLVEATLAIYFVGFAFGVALWGAFSDRIGRSPCMVYGLLTYILASIACGLSPTIEMLLFARFIQALGASVGSVITQTILRDCYTGAERSRVFSVVSGALAFSPAVGPLIGGFISETAGWRINFFLLATLGSLLAGWALLKLPETKPMNCTPVSLKKTAALMRAMLTSRVLLAHIILIGSANGIIFGFYEEAPFLFIKLLHMRPSLYGLFGLLIAASTIFSAHLSYRYASSISAEKLIRYGSVCTLAGGFILIGSVQLGIFNLGFPGNLTVLTGFSLVFIGIGLLLPNSLSLSLKPYQEMAGTAGSIFGGAYYCLIAFWTYLMSVLHNGTALPLPLFITCLGIFLLIGSKEVAKQPEGLTLDI